MTLNIELLERYALPDGVDSADRDYIKTVSAVSLQHRYGLLTDRELLEAILVAHVTWVQMI